MERRTKMEPTTKQFNVYLPPTLITRLKHLAVDRQASLSSLVGEALEALLSDEEEVVTGGVGHIYIETQNWGRTVAFWQALGFELSEQTDHLSGRLDPPGGSGPYLFVAEIGEDRSPETVVYLDVPPGVRVDLPHVVERVGDPVNTHWGTRTQTIRDPDGRLFVLEQSL